ncbi:hypothetical protein B0J18DRAFT_425944 [Chaetomium sp. MPI-SDFR-AT-0129]|nr:hypothetical protein B0J18DRAFT_425944 [Chaetomium sp. MPI-SDFR-AT-0129]
MAAAELIVAKTALSGALFRPDPRPCSRDDIETMLALVHSTIAECSPSNVQRCKQWALTNLVPSSARVPPFCKYLVALSRSFNGEKGLGDTVSSKTGRVPSAKRRRLHVLYILNDILYHAKYRTRDETFAPKLETALPSLVRSAASFQNCPKHVRKLQELVTLWEDNGYFSRGLIQQLRTAIEEGPSAREGETNKTGEEADISASAVAKAAKNAPWVLPATHGDPSTAWYDLPAGNWLPVLEPNSTRPMNPGMIKPLVLSQGPADKKLIAAVKGLLVDIDKIYTKQEANGDGPPPNIGQMGERVEIDEITGEVIDGDTYYGWSRAFCEKMKRRRRGRGGHNDHRDGDRGRTRSRSSRSYSHSQSRSPNRRHGRSGSSDQSSGRPAFKRQRLSPSPHSRRRSRSRSRSSSDRSRSGRHRSRSYRRSRSHSRSASRSRSRAYPNEDGKGKYQPRSPNYSSSRSRSRSGSRSRSPLRFNQQQQHHQQQQQQQQPFYPPGNNFMPQPPNTWGQQHPPPPPPSNMHFAGPHTHPHPSQQQPPPHPGYGMGFPVPPPPPQNYQGAWPPAPPPMMPHQQQNFFGPGGNTVPPPPPPPMPFAGGWVPHPPHSAGSGPPPPPGGHQNGFYQQGHGGQGQGQGRGGYQGRGGGYGRGGWR